MLTQIDLARVYDTILSIPGMNEQVKVSMTISRKNIFLLHSIVKRGMMKRDDEKPDSLLDSMSAEALKELENIADDFLLKAGLVELQEKLKSFASK